MNLNENKPNIREDDVFVASYPRSGNTWVRLLIADVILQLNGFETDTELPLNKDQIIVNIYRDDIRVQEQRINLPFRMIKTHEPAEEYCKRAVYIFRNASDSLLSYYHLLRRKPRKNIKTPQSIEDFCRQEVHQWCHNVLSYVLSGAEGRAEIHFVSYESLQTDTVNILKGICDFLGFQADIDVCRKAVNNHHFSKHQSIEQQGSDNHGHKLFFRKGKVVGYISGISKKCNEYIKCHAEPVYNMAHNALTNNSFTLCNSVEKDNI